MCACVRACACACVRVCLTQLSDPLPIAAWSHISCTLSAGSQAQNHTTAPVMRVYINGLLQGSADGVIGAKRASSDADINLKVGGDATGSFVGKLDELKLWSRPLSAAAIQKWMAMQVPSSSQMHASLVLYFHFDQEAVIETGITTAEETETEISTQIRGIGPARVRGTPSGGVFWDKECSLPCATIGTGTLAVQSSPLLCSFRVCVRGGLGGVRLSVFSSFVDARACRSGIVSHRARMPRATAYRAGLVVIMARTTRWQHDDSR